MRRRERRAKNLLFGAFRKFGLFQRCSLAGSLSQVKALASGILIRPSRTSLEAHLPSLREGLSYNGHDKTKVVQTNVIFAKSKLIYTFQHLWKDKDSSPCRGRRPRRSVSYGFAGIYKADRGRRFLRNLYADGICKTFLKTRNLCFAKG